MAGLQERLDEFEKSFESGGPPYNAPRVAIETMHRATAELKATEIEERALKVGDRAPSFTLFNRDSVQVASADLLRQRSVVIGFFRGAVSARYVIDRQSVIRAADVNADYPIRDEPSETVRELRKLA
jgi:hypothetical protein